MGIENLYGNVGFAYFFNGNGTSPVEGTTLKAISNLDAGVFSYALEVGPDKTIDIINVAQAENQLTSQILEAATTVYVGEYVFLPLIVR